MIIYENIFKRVLREQDMPISTSPMDQESPPGLNDMEAWKQNNPHIMDTEGLADRFETEGLPADMTEKYGQLINSWGNQIQDMIDTFKKMHKFATDKADQPGVGEIYSSIGGLVEKGVVDLNTIQGHLATLDSRIKLSTRRESEKNIR